MAYNADRDNFTVGKIANGEPYPTLAAHTIGNIGLTIINKGQFGTGFFTGDIRDPVTGEIAPSCIYPYPGGAWYLFTGAFWIGAVVGRDTLVSVGADGWHYIEEMWPDPYPKGDIIRRSITDPNDEEAVSEQDFIALYTDTVTSPQYVNIDDWSGRPHIPLNIEVTQRSYAWSYSYADDFILFDYSIKNIGRRTLRQVYMGFYVDGDAGSTNDWAMAQDDICGFRRSISSPFSNSCGWADTINIAWIADNNGINESEPDAACPYGANDPTSVTGMRVVRTPSDSLKYSFNWWISNVNASLDFGPRLIGSPDDPFRDFGGFLGTPMGDLNKYYIMRHEEFDYDQLFSAKDHGDEWLPRSIMANNFANGFDTRYLLSFGPFNIQPGEVLPISFAYVGGEEFHQPGNCEAFNEVFNASHPEDYYNELDFEKFGTNAIWASWIYDNPGVDTDNDGDSGKARLCVLDSAINEETGEWEPTVFDRAFYEGDGVPDFEGASPPPAPELWVLDNYPVGDTVKSLIIPSVNEFNNGQINIRWYGYRSETTKDVFSDAYDFEGYRVYQSLTNIPSDFILIASYDKEDYNKYVYDRLRNEYLLIDQPFTLDSLKALYGNDFDPYNHPYENPLIWTTNPLEDSAFYFLPQDWNMSDFRNPDLIHKIYPDQPYPSTLNHDSAYIHFPDELTEEGYFKYFMYEFTVKNLLPSQRYYSAVTAFDFGSPVSNLESLETPPHKNMISEFPQNQNSLVEERGLNVVVYPNPYRADAEYIETGFEARGITKENIIEERVRRIHFTNLPPKCTIRIFTLDGDLIREIYHDEPPDYPESMHEEWDLISRNTQMVVSGIYYYSVESEFGNQIGKLVIIM
jgi:hypothetical protein